MKNSGKITGMLLMLFIAGNLSLSAQRGMRGMRPDSAGMNRMRMEQRQMPMMMQYQDSLRMGGMHHGMAPMQRNNMDRFMCPMNEMGRQPRGMGQYQGMGQMGRGMQMMSPGMGHMGRGMGMGPGMRVMDNIPNLTDKQKKDIADLKGKQFAEMEKLRIDMQSKMKEMREAHRAKVMDILTPEQKKWVEENAPKPLEK
jgi:hypothetical protein